MMNIVITMAGLGSRFKKAGYKLPKYMIEAHGRTLFSWSMLSLEGYKDKNNTYIFIVRKEDNACAFIKAELEKFDIQNVEVLEIDYLTDGQATTALLAKALWLKEEQLLIYNIDTFVYPDQMRTEQLKGDGFIPCFKGEGDHWSFVKLDENGKAIDVKEKVRISENCTVGAYYFKSAQLFEDIYNKFYIENTQVISERFIAPMYSYMIKKGYELFISDIDVDAVHVLGTPKELDEFKSYNLDECGGL